MSTPSSRLVLVMTTRISPARSAASIARRRCTIESRVMRPRRVRSGSSRSAGSWREIVRQFLGESSGIGEDDGRAIPFDGPPQPFQQPAVAQAAVRRFVGSDQAFNLDSSRWRPGGGRAVTTRQVRDGPTRNRAAASPGRQVAERPTRTGSCLAL